jgi:hypothetical protein
MTHTNNITVKPFNLNPFVKPALIGAGIGLLVIGIFLSGVHHPKPEWGSLWMVKPLIITPGSGAAGGVFYALMGGLRSQGAWKTVLANTISVLVFIIGLWMGIVLGLNGTLWN